MKDVGVLTKGEALCDANLADWSGGHWDAAPAAPVTGLSFDSRTVSHGDLFAALSSGSADGHDYVMRALSAGAAGAIVRDGWNAPGRGLPLLRVRDPLEAMHAIARGYRRLVKPFVVGVTGSVGKSTVKTWTAALFAGHFRTASTIANFNNNIGLPVSLLAMDPDAEAGVFEVGMNHKGELAPLCRTLEPDAAVVTAVGPVHIEFFESVEAIADEKAELLRSLPAGGFAVLDASSPYFGILAGASKARVVTVKVRRDFGGVQEADYEARVIDELAGVFDYREKTTGILARVATGFQGAHNVLNALYAMAAAREGGVPPEKVLLGAKALPSMKMRWERETEGGVTWVNDAYNANPIAMAAALRLFTATFPGPGRRIYVLGEMRELGEDSRRFHDETGALVASLGGDVLVGVGEAGGWMIDAAVAGGFKGQTVRAADARDAGRLLAGIARDGDAILLKASHGVALEKVRPAYLEALG